MTSIGGVKLGVGKGQRIPGREKMSKVELPCWQGCLGEFSLTSVCSYCEDLKTGSAGSQMIKVCTGRRRPLQTDTVRAVTAETAGWRERKLDTDSKALMPSAASG